MAIPDYQTLMLFVLRLAAAGETDIRHCTEVIAKDFGVSPQELQELLPSGKQTVLSNRTHWAKTYLVKAGLLRMTGRGRFAAAERGMEVLANNPARIDNALLGRFPEFQAFRARSAARQQDDVERQPDLAPATERATPEERIEAAYLEISAELRSVLLDRIVGAKPAFFETLIIDLMIAMGYGGSAPEAGQRLGRSGDGGVDGLINEDVLGLDSIYLQAKRYAPGNVIGVEKVREFAGSLVERGANKGVFVTTSHFAHGAIAYAERIPQRLILIDGDTLTHLMLRHNVGVRKTRVIELKKLDMDYFEDDDQA
jgi:restriction system protein